MDKNSTQMKTENQTLNVISFLYRNRKPIIYVVIFAALISSIASFIIKPKYKSTAILFPANSLSTSKFVLDDNTNNYLDFVEFGRPEELERLVQILESDDLKERVAKQLNLYKHYEIKEDDPYRKTYFMYAYSSNISVKKTEYYSVKIDVMDINPDTAALIANEIVAQVDSVRNAMILGRSKSALEIVEKELLATDNELKIVEDTLTKLMGVGVYDYFTQVEAYSKGYAKAIAAGNQSGAKQLEAKMKDLERYGTNYQSLKDIYMELRTRKNIYLRKKETFAVNINNNIPFKFVVDKATAADKKSYPVKSLVVGLSVLAALAMTILLLIIKEKYSSIKQEIL